MRWRGREGSDNIEDRRGMQAGPAVAGGGGILVVLMLLATVFLGDKAQPVVKTIKQAQQQQAARQQQSQQVPAETNEAEEELKEFISVVLKDTEVVWNKLFTEQLGKRYNEPTLILFRDSVRSACGMASSATGPFYCPGDDQVYLDMSFFDELHKRFGAPGDFAMAYVVAHEVAHHVQNELGISDQVQSQRMKGGDKVAANRLSVRLELQADFLSGVWAYHAQKQLNFLERGDLEEAMNCAQAIGDDRIQKQAQGYVVPDAFTHGTSAQRARWFRAGLESGNLENANQLFSLPYDQL